MINSYIKIARPDHWFKNIFMLPGILLGWYVAPTELEVHLLIRIVIGVFATCLAASANYVINEWLDAEFDKYHPVKKNRPSVTQNLERTWIYTEYIILIAASLTLASLISQPFFITMIVFLVMGFMYNVRPFRTKDRPYLDVISESFNNPLRLCLGWFILVNSGLPPSSIMLSYWMGGAFLMGAKRYAEYRFISDPEMAGLYRTSFRFYDEKKLLISTVYYALLSALFLGAFLIKHKIELILSFPFFSLLFAWYLHMTMQKDSDVQRPEKLYRNKFFVIFVIGLAILTSFLLIIDIPWLRVLLD